MLRFLLAVEYAPPEELLGWIILRVRAGVRTTDFFPTRDRRHLLGGTDITRHD